MRINASMTKGELNFELEKSIKICDRLIKEMHVKRECKQAILDRGGWCDFDLVKILEEAKELTKEEVEILIQNTQTLQ